MISSPERFWPLDLCVGVLACLVIWVAIQRLSFEDQRLLYNTWTYVLSVPISASLLTIFSRSIIHRSTQQSIQIGLLFSLLLHLLLLVLAINVVIFHQYFPRTNEAHKRTSPFNRRTVSETIFTPSRSSTDWSAPIPASVQDKSFEVEVTTEPNRSSDQNQLSNPTTKIAQETDIAKLSTPLQSQERRSPTTPGETRNSRRHLSTVADYQPTNQEPTTPLVSPADESLVGSMEREIAESPRRVAPITSRISRPSLGEPQHKSSERIETSVELRTIQTEPSIANLNTNRLDIGTPESLANPPSSAKSPAPISVKPTPTVDDNAPALLLRDQTPESRSEREMVSQYRPAKGISDLGVPDRNSLNGQNIKIESNDSLPPADELTRSIRAKLSMSNSSVGNTITNLPKVDNPSSPNYPRGNDLSPRNNLPAPVGDLAQRFPSLPPLFTINDSPNADTNDSIGISRERISSQPADVIDLSPPIAMTDRVPALDNLRPERPYSKLSPPKTLTANPAIKITPAPSFTQRVMRINQSNPRTITNENPAPTQDTEDSIELGLQYLSTVQNDDGSWSLQNHGSEVILQSDTAATGLALLAYQGAGYTHEKNQYAERIQRGIQFLLTHQQSDGNLFIPENAISNQNVAFYSHGIASLALCEAYGMTGDENLKEGAQRALDFIARTQHRQRGGWRYNAQISSDTSVTGWMMMALKSGELAGLDTLPRTYQGISFWLSLAQSNESGDRYRYNPFAPDTPTQRHGRIETPTMTAVAGLMRMYGGWTRDTPELRSIADYLLKFPPTLGNNETPKRDTYYWYYATQVMFHMGGDHWRRWNEQLTPLLLNNQIKDGPFKGSWDPLTPLPDRWAAHAGRVYVTTMNLLNLEIYYRHLPIYEKTGAVSTDE